MAIEVDQVGIEIVEQGASRSQAQWNRQPADKWLNIAAVTE
jgi:hypothetical protein